MVRIIYILTEISEDRVSCYNFMKNTKKEKRVIDGEKKFTVKDLYELYVVQNYCMDAVSKITCIPLVPLSRIFQKYELPEYLWRRKCQDNAGKDILSIMYPCL